MNLFDTLLEIKTGKKNLMTKAIYVPNSIMGNDGTYYIYYYDLVNHTFYINDIEGPCIESRASAINMIEKIVTKSFLQEISSYGEIVKKILQSTKPKVIYFYRQKHTELIMMDRVKLTPIYNIKREIIRFKNPTWEKDSSKKLDIKHLNFAGKSLG